MVYSHSTIPNIAGHASLTGSGFSDHIVVLVVGWELYGQLKIQ